MAQNRDRNWQDRDQQHESRGRWQGGEETGRGEHGQHHGFEEQQGRGSWNEGREHLGSGQQQSGWGGSGPQQGGEWNRMGRYGEEGWQGGGTGRHGEGGNYRMDRDFGSRERGSWGGYGGSPFVGESSGSRGSWGGGSGSVGSGGMGSRGGYGSGSYGSGSYGTSAGSGYGSGYGYGSSGYGTSQGQRDDQQRGFWDRASDEVSSWLGDEQARRRREMDEHRGRGPKGYTRSDERIREDVSDRFTDDGWLDASDIEVEVSASEVTLTGQVNSREEKRRAEDIAEAISGVKHVQNNLRVKDRSAASSGGEGATTLLGSGTTSGSRRSI